MNLGKRKKTPLSVELYLEIRIETISCEETYTVSSLDNRTRLKANTLICAALTRVCPSGLTTWTCVFMLGECSLMFACGDVL